MKAVTGENPDSPGQNSLAISDPQTLQDAADGFWYAQQVLLEAATNISSQAEALAGPNGPWQGDAAQSLYNVMQTLSQQTQDMADTLSGGITGDDNVPQQLADNAAHLRDAINKLNDIDVYYATEAVQLDPSLAMDNGQVRISGSTDQIKGWLNGDMQQVLVTLASHYQVTIDHVALSTAPTNPTSASSGAAGDPYGGYGVPSGAAGSGGTSGAAGDPYGGYGVPSDAAGSGGTSGAAGDPYGGYGVPSGAAGDPYGGYGVPSGAAGYGGTSGAAGDPYGGDSGASGTVGQPLTLVRHHTGSDPSQTSSSGSGDASRTLTVGQERLKSPGGPGPVVQPTQSGDGFPTSGLVPGELVSPAEGPGPVVQPTQTQVGTLAGF